MSIIGMDHFTVTTDRLTETVAFYGALGLRVGPRPDFRVGGAWLYTGDRPVLHLIEKDSDRMPAAKRGLIDHIAFHGRGLHEVVTWLQECAIPCSLIRTPAPFTQWQLFFFDPNGAEVEIDFDKEEPAPENWKTFGPRGA